MNAPALSSDQITQLAETFRLLGDASRLSIVLACQSGPQAVGQLAATLDLSPSLVSHHLRLLRAARLLRPERRGRHVYYGANDAHVSQMLRNMAVHVAEADEDHEEISS